MEQRYPQTMQKIIICEVYFKLILMYDDKMWTLKKRNQRKMQVIDIKCCTNIDGKTWRVRIRNEILRKGVSLQNLLTELKEK
jgi:hypothetical protein